MTKANVKLLVGQDERVYVHASQCLSLWKFTCLFGRRKVPQLCQLEFEPEIGLSLCNRNFTAAQGQQR